MCTRDRHILRVRERYDPKFRDVQPPPCLSPPPVAPVRSEMRCGRLVGAGSNGPASSAGPPHGQQLLRALLSLLCHWKRHDQHATHLIRSSLPQRIQHPIAMTRPVFLKPLNQPANHRPFDNVRENGRVSQGKGLEAQESAVACQGRCRAGRVRASRRRVCGRLRGLWRAGHSAPVQRHGAGREVPRGNGRGGLSHFWPSEASDGGGVGLNSPMHVRCCLRTPVL